MVMRRHLVYAVFLASCSGPDEPTHLSLSLSIDEGRCPFGHTPEELAFDCDGQVGLYVVKDTDPADTILASACATYTGKPGATLRQLPEALTPLTLPEAQSGATVSVELYVYGNNLNAPGECPRTAFPASGPPVSPQGSIPAYAGQSSPVRLGDSVTLDIPLRCYVPMCSTSEPTRALEVRVEDLSTRVGIEEEDASTIDVHVGTLEVDDTGGDRHANFKALATPFLSRTFRDPLWLTWDGTLPQRAAFPEGCPATLVSRFGGGAGVSTLSCQGTIQAELASTHGYYIESRILDDILDGLFPQRPRFPAGGLLVGLVTDEGGSPLSGATVKVKDGAGQVDVVYLDTDRKPALLERTTDSGYFVVTGVRLPTEPGATRRCCAPLTATVGDKTADSPAPVGLVDGNAMSTVIRLETTP